VGDHSCTTGNRSRNLCYDSWSLSHLGYLYPGTAPVMIKLDHDRNCPWVQIAQVTKAPTISLYVKTHAHTHTAQMGYSVVNPGVGMRHLDCPKNPDGLNLSIYVSECVNSTHVYICARRRD